MLSGEIILEHLKSQPFRPFRLHLSSGRSFLVRHPELVSMGVSHVIIFTPRPEDRDNDLLFQKVSLFLLESLEMVPADTAA